MTFLELCQRAVSECGAPDGALPSTVVSQRGEALRFVNWVNNAWLDIQNLHGENWKFMRATASFTTVEGQPTYTPAECNATNFGYWYRDTFRCYNTVAGITGEIFMSYLDYEAWRNTYMYGGFRETRTQPTDMSVAPNESICLGPYPAEGYTVYGDYNTVPSLMAVDGDLPGLLPTQFHMVIVWAVMKNYGAYESAPEVYQRGENEYNKLLALLRRNQLAELLGADAVA